MLSAPIPISAGLRRLLCDEEGQGLAEYALILALTSLVCVSSLATLGDSFDAGFRKVADTLRMASATL